MLSMLGRRWPKRNAGSGDAPLRVALVTNMPVPYRIPVLRLLAARPDIELTVFYCSGREPDRQWSVDVLQAAGASESSDPDRGVAVDATTAERSPRIVYLPERFITWRGRYIHFNPGLRSQLRALDPHVVVTTGFNPTHLVAFAWACLLGAHHVAMTDGTLISERELSFAHRLVRRIVYARSAAFVGPSEGSFALLRSYGVDERAMFKSHLCADNAAFEREPQPPEDERIDLLFCGRFVDVKNPMFALEVARRAALRLGRRVSIAFVGSGELEPAVREQAARLTGQVEAWFPGFAQPAELPARYKAARVFLFPTSWDPWGVVANEACAAGLPVLVTPAAGAAGEIVRDGENGLVLPLDIESWTEAAVRLLGDAGLRARMGVRGAELVQPYTYAHAAEGLAQAVRHAAGRPLRRRVTDGTVTRGQPYRARVLIVQRRMTHYRVALFDRMRALLAARGIDLVVAYGDPMPSERSKGDDGFLPWGVHLPCRYLLGGRLCWQNAMPLARQSDLVVTTQENKLLFNYLLLAQRTIKRAFWGHGRNFQSRGGWLGALSERFKRFLANRVDWWFAYTEVSARCVREAGFPRERISVVNNAIDTAALQRELEALAAEVPEVARARFGLPAQGRIGLLIASLYEEKRLDFLIDAAHEIRAQIPDFQLVIVGDGPQREKITAAVAEAGGWIHWLGVRTGAEKASLLRVADVMLCPGLVGLSILDAFVARVPLVTTDCDLHSPEIAYLQPGINGLMTHDSIDAYVASVIGLLGHPARLEHLREGCARSADEISLERMAERFCEGIERCLAEPTLRAGLIARPA